MGHVLWSGGCGKTTAASKAVLWVSSGQDGIAGCALPLSEKLAGPAGTVLVPWDAVKERYACQQTETETKATQANRHHGENDEIGERPHLDVVADHRWKIGIDGARRCLAR